MNSITTFPAHSGFSSCGKMGASYSHRETSHRRRIWKSAASLKRRKKGRFAVWSAWVKTQIYAADWTRGTFPSVFFRLCPALHHCRAAPEDWFFIEQGTNNFTWIPVLGSHLHFLWEHCCGFLPLHTLQGFTFCLLESLWGDCSAQWSHAVGLLLGLTNADGCCWGVRKLQSWLGWS